MLRCVRTLLSLVFVVLLCHVGPVLAQGVGLTLIPPGPLPADGVTPVMLTLYAPGGQLPAKLQYWPSLGEVGEAVAAGDRLFQIPYTPPAVAVPTQVVLSLKDRKGGLWGGNTLLEQQLVLVPPQLGYGLVADPAVLDAQPGSFSTVWLTPHGGPAQAAATPPALVATVGTVTQPLPFNEGSWTARYDPPAGETDRWAMLVTDPAPGSATPLGVAAVKLGSPPKKGAPQLVVMSPPAQVPADPAVAVPIKLAGIDGKGQPLVATISLAASVGTVDQPAPTNVPGTFLAWYHPPALPQDQPVALHATIVGEGNGELISTQLSLAPGGPASLALRPSVEQLTTETRAEVLVRQLGAEGQVVKGESPVLTLVGAKARGSITAQADGSWKQRLTLEADQPLGISAAPVLKPTGLPVQHLLAWPRRASVGPDASVEIVVVAVDALGYPVPSAPVQVQVLAGAGQAPALVTTDAQGVAFVPYHAGKQIALAWLQLTHGQHWTQCVVPQGIYDLPVLPPRPWAERAQLEERWKALLPEVTLQRSKPKAAPVAQVAPSTDGVQALSVWSDPAVLDGMAQVSLWVRAADADGEPVAGEQLGIVASAGMVGPVVDRGDGTYLSPLALPPGFTGSIQVSISAKDGAITVAQELGRPTPEQVQAKAEEDKARAKVEAQKAKADANQAAQAGGEMTGDSTPSAKRTGLTSGELLDTANTLEKGRFTIHPLTQPSAVGITDKLDLKVALLPFFTRPNVAAEYAILQDDSNALSVEPAAKTSWNAKSFQAGGMVRYTRALGKHRATAGAGGEFVRSTFVTSVNGESTTTVFDSVHTPVELSFDLCPKESTAWHFVAKTDPYRIVKGTNYVVVGAHWNKGWKRYRLALGLNVLTAGIPETGIEFIDEAMPDIAVLPLPYLAMWWKI